MNFILNKFNLQGKITAEKKKIGIPKDDDEIIYRVFSVLCYFFILIIVGIPVWWYTTRVYRATLPLSEINQIKLPEKSNKQLGVPLSLEYDILITVVDPFPGNIKINLKGEDIEANLQPFLEKISPAAKFVIKSQWVYLTVLGANFLKIKNHFALPEHQLIHVITPLESKLWSHQTTRPCINLILYIPPCDGPVYIYDNSGEILESNAFLSPGWGGIYILNPDEDSCTKNKTFEPSLQLITSTFISQLTKLFNVDTDFMVFEKRKAEEMIDSTHRTLKSLAKLLYEIPSIVISDQVAEKINVAVKHAKEAEEYLQQNEIHAALKAAKIAYGNAETAFGDSSLLALLYFPDDQKYAVYIPLFLPVMIPVLMSLFTVWKWHVERSQKLKKKAD